MEQERGELEEALGDVLDAAVGHPAREERVGLRKRKRPYGRQTTDAGFAGVGRGWAGLEIRSWAGLTRREEEGAGVIAASVALSRAAALEPETGLLSHRYYNKAQVSKHSRIREFLKFPEFLESRNF